ncbi:oligopeptidase A, partial [Enterobacter hormaechei]|nr:oligopeptidase A [Enterobacter hormaechei]
MTNPLLVPSGLPKFSSIKPEHVVPAVKEVIANYRQTVEKILAENTVFTWDNLCQPLAEAGDKQSRAWSPVNHLNSVKNSPELRAVYEESLPLLSEFSTWLGQHKGLYQA